MKVTTTVWRPTGEWTVPLPALDSAQTLVWVFGDRLLEHDTGPLEDLAACYPESVIVGCSTSGQIAGGDLHDDACVVSIARFDRTTLRRARTAVSAGGDSHAAAQALGSQLAA